MVLARHQNYTRKRLAAFIKALDAFQVKVIGWLVKQNHVRVLQHHAAHHAAHFLTTAQHVCLLHNVVSGKQHLAQESTEKRLIRIGYVRRNVLAKPFHQRQSRPEKIHCSQQADKLL